MPPKIPYKQVKINLKPEHYAKLSEFAEGKGVSKSDWIRQKIGINYEEARKPKQEESTKSLPTEVLYELKKIGNNINQLATRANVNKELDRQILSSLVRIEDRLKALL